MDGLGRRLALRTASLSRPIACQHFFKPEAVFFGALVYSRRSASRFPNARSDEANSSEGNMAKKAKKAKKAVKKTAKTAAKKTAKKTKKVSKKK
jgi:hypothetical protein